MAELDNKLNDPLGTAPKIPSVSGALRMTQDIARQQVESTKRLGELEAQKLEKAPLIQKEKLEAEKSYRDVAAGKRDVEIGQAEQDMSQFKVSQDSIGGMSALGTAILMLGQLLGRTGGQQSAMGAIQGMTGMMQGYTKGRADEFKRGQIEFDRNFKILQDKIKRANDKFQAALTEMPYNTIEAQTKAAQALAELDSPILREKYNKQGLVETAEFVKTLFNAAEKAADRAQQLAVAQAKAATTKTGGALLAGRAENIREAFAQAAKDIVNITRFPEGTMLGTFSGLTGADANTMLGGIRNAIARGVTEKEQRMLEVLLAGIEGHMAFALGGGYASSQSKARMDQYKAQLARAGDDPVQVPLMLARFRQEMNILAENFASKPGATPEMNEAVQRYNDMINKAVPFTVENVVDAEFGTTKKPTTAPAAPTAPTATTPTTPAATKPTLQEFLEKARKSNPGATDDELTEFYNKKYGTR